MISEIYDNNSVPCFVNGGGASLISASCVPQDIDTEDYVDGLLADCGEPQIVDKNEYEDLVDICDLYGFDLDDFTAVKFPRTSATGENMDMVILYYGEDLYTYDVHFNNDTNSNNKGFSQSLEYCRGYIELYNGTDESYFADYKGGTVSIVCNETGETVYEEEEVR